MKEYSVLLFDLDGTLTDPGVGITNSVAYALEKMGRPVPERSALYPFIGPPLRESFQQLYHFSDEDATQAIGYYREYYRDRGIWENVVYPGIPQLLEAAARQKTLLLATSKPEVFARQILDHFNLSRYFAYIAGADLDEKRVQKSEMIAYALESGGVTDRDRALMTGDRSYDVRGAQEQGLDSLGVLYGYGGQEELQSAGATYLAKTVDDLSRLLLS